MFDKILSPDDIQKIVKPLAEKYHISEVYIIQKIVKPLAEKYHISEVYIFGSYARNEATANSDVA